MISWSIECSEWGSAERQGLGYVGLEVERRRNPKAESRNPKQSRKPKSERSEE